MNINDLKKYRIGVLAGGPSSERDISLKSGEAVFRALITKGLDTSLLDVDTDNLSLLIKDTGIDLAFIALHGRFGEDGTVQRKLESMGVPYTGSGPAASQAALDKIVSKEKFIEKGIDVPAYSVMRAVSDASKGRTSFPCVVKPRYEGSSIGLSIIDSADMLPAALEKALKYDKEVLVEEFIRGREITVGILGEEALPVVEIIPAGGVYDFAAKYHAKDTVYKVPADLSADITDLARKTGLKAHKTLGCEGFSRVDMRLAEDGRIYVLEVNTIPGLTERSLLPMAAKEAGLDFSALCVKMLLGAFDKK
jgi:D-alanine-D-alanine ligase